MDGFSPFSVIDASQSIAHTHDCRNISHIAVGIPSAHVTDIQSVRKVSFPVQQSQDHHRSIGNDMAVARISVIAKILFHIPKTLSPPFITVGLVKAHNCVHDSGILAILRNIR